MASEKKEKEEREEKDTVAYTVSNGIAWVSFNRPEKRNAISFEFIDELLPALEEAKGGTSQVVILTGAGKAFCSGMDLENLKQLLGRSDADNLRDSQKMARLFRTLYDFPLPTIAAESSRVQSAVPLVFTLDT